MSLLWEALTLGFCQLWVSFYIRKMGVPDARL